ncbi:MAG: hypothetical protein AAF085_05740 [Planctomycetota bacterium]
MFSEDTCVTLVPYFTVNEGQLDAFKALGPRFIERTKTESAVLHYAFSYEGMTAHCREGYEDAAGVLAHLENVGDILGEALKLSELSRLEVHGPAGEVDQLREPLKDLNPQFFVLEAGGIRR